MKVGYSFWGFLGDTKYDSNYAELSTPDGNAFYSWSIIKEFLNRGMDTICVMPDRDAYGYKLEGENLFSAWCKDDRNFAYSKSKHYTIEQLLENSDVKKTYNLDFADIYDMWDSLGLCDCDFILHEWRMEVPGRNDMDSKIKCKEGWQPDLYMQMCLIEYTRAHKIPLIIFDLDYKLDLSLLKDLPHIHVIELGFKNVDHKKCTTIEIPFDFSHINDFDILDIADNYKSNLVYVGNRYERDWCIDAYIPNVLSDVTVYGNWNESGRDSKTRWPAIKFGARLQTRDMREVYSTSVATVLLAKEEYCKHKFMTARILESIFYGTVPLFIEEYGKGCIVKYAGKYASLLTVKNKVDVIDRIIRLKLSPSLRKDVISYLRRRLKFMDVKNFVDGCIEVKDYINYSMSMED